MDLVLLQEAKVHVNVESVVYSVWGSKRCSWEWVSSDWTSGSLTTIRDDNKLKKEDVFRSQRVLVIKFLLIAEHFRWAVANIYGPNEEAVGGIFWNSLSSIRSLWLVPWCLVGNFNMV